MKKTIAIVLAILALLALSVTAFASADAGETAEPAEASTRASREMKTDIEAAVPEEDAVAAALKDAGFTEDDVTVTRTRLREKTDEDGNTVVMYTVRFHTEDTTYKYHVDAETGAILDSTVTEGVSEEHSRGEDGGRGGRASGEPGEDGRGMKASGETDEDAGGEASSEMGRRSGRSGRGNKSASSETDAAAVLTDTTAA